MDLKRVKKLIELVEGSNITEFEFSEKDLKIRLVKDDSLKPKQSAPITTLVQHTTTTPLIIDSPANVLTNTPTDTSSVTSNNIIEIRSPTVGLFYRSPATDPKPYVRVGDTIEPDTIVGRIDVLGINHEIKAEQKALIIEILIEDGRPVDFGKLLFRIETEKLP